MMTSSFLDEDIFARPPRRVAQAALPLGRRITCRVCNAPGAAQDDAVLLCDVCRADAAAAHAHCQYVLEACTARADAAGQAWLDAQAAADDAALVRLRKAEAVIAAGRDTDPKFLATWQREKAAGTPLGALLVAYEVYTTEMRLTATQRQQAARGLAELEQMEER